MEIKFTLEIDNNGEYIDTFVFDVYKSIKQYNTFSVREKYSYYKTQIGGLSNPKYMGTIPVGSIEFVNKFMEINKIEVPKPLNVPIYLRKYCRRDIIDIGIESLLDNYDKFKEFYIKSNESYKDFEINKVKYFTFEDTLIKNFFISSQIVPEIVSEYRCFILGGRILSINNYIGDPIGLEQIHITKLKIIIDDIKIRAYTVDIAILEDGSLEIIELHHGYSCGNYGFAGDKYLSFLINGINQLK